MIKMDKYKKIVDVISTKTKTRFRPASPTSIKALKKFNVPQSMIEFYKKYVPDQGAYNGVYLWSIPSMKKYITMTTPGLETLKYGYIGFARTVGGDFYCFNCNKLNRNGEPGIVLIDHEAVFQEMPREEMDRIAKPIARNLLEFLEQFSRGKVDEEGIY